MEQIVLPASNHYEALDKYLIDREVWRIFLVCGRSIQYLTLDEYFSTLEERTGICVVRFSHFSSNPQYESVVEGVRTFREANCDSIVAVGGGSAIDVAKCVKLFSNAEPDINYLQQTIVPNNIKLIAIPTTAGSGSESTEFAVLYYGGRKQSIENASCLPSAMLLDGETLKSLPDYQRKSTMLDAMCHAIESFWSISATAVSKQYSKRALEMILDNMASYLQNDSVGNTKMLLAANLAGKAINIARTTAGHALCYGLTDLYGISHGHSAALCVSKLWPYMLNNMNRCIDTRGQNHLKQTFQEIADAMGCKKAWDAVEKYNDIFSGIDLQPLKVKKVEFEALCAKVNEHRLKNNPVYLDREAILNLYHEIFSD